MGLQGLTEGGLVVYASELQWEVIPHFALYTKKEAPPRLDLLKWGVEK